MKKLLIITLLVSLAWKNGNLLAQDAWECATTEDLPPQFQSGPQNSENGMAFTPRGTVNALVVYIAYKNTLTEDISNWDIPIEIRNNTDPENIAVQHKRGLPKYFQANGRDPHTFMFDDLADFQDPFIYNDPVNQVTNVSYKFNLMSKPNQDFRLVGKAFEMKTIAGSYEPVVIIIDPLDYPNVHSFADVHAIALQKMALLNPDASWYEQFDQRQNTPGFQFDNSVVNSDGSPATPDGKIDFIIFMHRYKLTNAFTGMSGWPVSGGGFSSGSISNGQGSLPGNKICNNGFMAVGGGVPTQLFIHEMCHSIYDASHTYNANGTVGPYLYAQVSGMAACAGLSSTGNALHPFERWYLGYITPHEVSSDETITIGDINATGDAIRVNIPHTNQRLWIYGVLKDWVNSQNAYFDDNIGPGAYRLTNNPRGVHLSIESAGTEKSEVYKFSDWVNCFYDLNAVGNYGRRWNPSGPILQSNWGHNLLRIDHNLPEAIGGINFTSVVREDLDGIISSSTLLNTIP